VELKRERLRFVDREFYIGKCLSIKLFYLLHGKKE